MPDNKNQHFVPRCYLRPFCNPGNEKAITLYNVKRKLFISGAPLKKQCSKNYFYGQDQIIEENIQVIERNYSNVLRNVCMDGYILRERDALFLIRFWLFQYFRTDAAAQQAVDVASVMADSLEVPENESEFDLRTAIFEHLKMFLEYQDAMNDLKVRLIKNYSSSDFITSDDPAIFANKWYQTDPRPNRYKFGGGLKSAGAILILPLTPKILFLAFDGDVYSVPHVKGWAKMKSPNDVAAVNQHQHLNYQKNLYCVDEKNCKLAELEMENAENRKSDKKYEIEFMVEHGSFDDKRKIVAILDDGKQYVKATEAEAKNIGTAIFRNRRVRPILDTWPSILKPRRKGIVCTNGSYGGYLRKYHAKIAATIEPDQVFWEEPVEYRLYRKKR